MACLKLAQGSAEESALKLRSVLEKMFASFVRDRTKLNIGCSHR